MAARLVPVHGSTVGSCTWQHGWFLYMAARLVPKEQNCRKIKLYNEIRKVFTAYTSASRNGGSF
jgi:hypothetical protein